jgi:hypothetical protein
LEGNSRALVAVLTCYFPRWFAENHLTTVRINGVPAEIRTGNLPNKRLQRYRNINLLPKKKDMNGGENKCTQGLGGKIR